MSTSESKELRKVVTGAILPVMPKGVEHQRIEQLLRHAQEAILPVMPKGVEHLEQEEIEPNALGDSSRDAERR